MDKFMKYEKKADMLKSIIEIIERNIEFEVEEIELTICEEVNYNYNYIRNMFKDLTGITLDKYIKRRRFTEGYPLKNNLPVEKIKTLDINEILNNQLEYDYGGWFDELKFIDNYGYKEKK